MADIDKVDPEEEIAPTDELDPEELDKVSGGALKADILKFDVEKK